MSHEFKVGDRVRVIDHRPSDASDLCWSDEIEKTLGQTGIVKHVFKGYVGVRFHDGDWYNYISSWLIPVEAESSSAK